MLYISYLQNGGLTKTKRLKSVRKMCSKLFIKESWNNNKKITCNVLDNVTVKLQLMFQMNMCNRLRVPSSPDFQNASKLQRIKQEQNVSYSIN